MCLYPTKRNVSSQWDFDKHWKVYISFFIRWVMGFAVLTSCSTNDIVTYSNWNSFSDWTRTCHVSRIKFTNSLGKQQIELSTCTVIRSCTLKPLQIDYASQLFSFHFWVRRYNKTLTDRPRGKQWLLFPLDLNVPLGCCVGEHSGCRGNSLFPLEAVIKCLSWLNLRPPHQ